MRVKFFILGSLALTLLGTPSLVTAQTFTAVGDTYISSQDPDDVKQTSDVVRMISNDRTDNTRYSYVRFDISSLGADVASAKFELVHVAGGNGMQTYEVFGLLEGEDDWDEATLTWNTSANLTTSSPTDVLDVGDVYGGGPLAAAFADDAAPAVGGAGNGTVLTAFDATGGVPVAFLNADSDGLVSFIVAEQIVGGVDNFGDGWASRENTSGFNGPRLILTVVPEPASAALLLGSLAMLVGFRRHSR